MKGLIIAPGLDTNLAIHCINTIKPDSVAFIVNDKVVDLLPIINEKLDYHPQESKRFLIKDAGDVNEIIREFISAFYWLTETKGIKEIYVDGTDCLVITGFSIYFIASFIEIFKELAGENIELKIIFTTCDWQMIELEDGNLGGATNKGTEKIITLEDPINTIGFVLSITACNLFNKGFYSSAESNFKTLEKRTSGDQNILYNSLSLLALSYNLWDKFAIEESLESLGNAQVSLEKISKINFVQELIGRTKIHLDILQEMQKGNFLEKIVDMFENGNRKIQRGLFDDALARYYRCLEMIAQYILSQYGIDTAEPDFNVLSKETIERYSKERGGALPEKYKEGTGGIAAKDAFLLLYCLDHSLGKRYKQLEPKFLGLLTARNQSILGHGTSPINLKKAQAFCDEILKPFLEELCKIEDKNLSSMLENHTFPILPTNIKDLLLELKKIG